MEVSDNVPGLMFLDGSVFMISEIACSEGQASRFVLIVHH